MYTLNFSSLLRSIIYLRKGNIEILLIYRSLYPPNFFVVFVLCIMSTYTENPMRKYYFFAFSYQTYFKELNRITYFIFILLFPISVLSLFWCLNFLFGIISILSEQLPLVVFLQQSFGNKYYFPSSENVFILFHSWRTFSVATEF